MHVSMINSLKVNPLASCCRPSLNREAEIKQAIKQCSDGCSSDEELAAAIFSRDAGLLFLCKGSVVNDTLLVEEVKYRNHQHVARVDEISVKESPHTPPPNHEKLGADLRCIVRVADIVKPLETQPLPIVGEKGTFLLLQ